MKIKEICKKYGLEEQQFKNYFFASKYNKSYSIPIGFGGMGVTEIDIFNSVVENAVADYKQYLIDLDKEQREEEEKKIELSKILISSGFSFDGYTITKYSGYISGDDAAKIDRGYDGIFSGATDVGEELSAVLVKIRRNALNELKEAAYNLGCNAIIGVDFDYLTLEPQTANMLGGTTYLPYVICVTANGNAVVIEKND